MAKTSKALTAEITELQSLLEATETVGNRHDLEQLLHHKKKALEAATATADAVFVPRQVETSAVSVETATHPVASDVATFTEISRFGWEDEGFGKEKVDVYIMSGIDGVGDLPQENVTCHFTKTLFDLKIFGLNNKNYRLVKQPLEKEIDPSKSSYRVKKNRITISLHKVEKNTTWMNLTAKNPLKTNKPDTTDPSAGIMDMMKNMYEEGDDEMKRTIAKAWSESRNKTGAASPF